MIGFLFRLAIVLMVGLVAAWVLTIGSGADAASRLSRETGSANRVFPRSGDSDALLSCALTNVQELHELPFAELLPEDTHVAVAMSLVVVSIRTKVVLRILPLAVTLFSIATLLGLRIRDKTRHTQSPDRHYSVTLGYLSKFVLGGGVFLMCLFSLTPVSLAYWVPYLGTIVGSLGAYGYASTLIDRL